MTVKDPTKLVALTLLIVTSYGDKMTDLQNDNLTPVNKVTTMVMILVMSQQQCLAFGMFSAQDDFVHLFPCNRVGSSKLTGF